MITALKQFIAGLIHVETKKINEESPLDLKNLMATNGWESLPEKKVIPIYVRDALIKVMNFIEFTPPSMKDPKSTNIQKLDEISRNFMDDYSNWLVTHEKEWNITKIMAHLSKLKEDKLATPKTDEELFSFLSSQIIYRYYLNSRVNETPEPEPEVA